MNAIRPKASMTNPGMTNPSMSNPGVPPRSRRPALPAVVDTIEQATALYPTRPLRVLTGDRPTGDLHVGHLLGTLRNRVALQKAGAELLVVIADYQVITDRDSSKGVAAQVFSVLADYLACGIDAEQAVIFPHSAIAALNQLLLPFLSLVTDSELRRNPTVKAELADSNRSLSGLLLTYPVHQAADILFCHGDLVPAGEDQLPHVEITRLIARRFNQRYGPVFAEPAALLSSTPTVLGLDGRKMSKSRGNAIALGDSADRTAEQIRAAVTDSQRRITFDPVARPGVSALVALVAGFTGAAPDAVAEEIGDRGAAALKATATEVINTALVDHRARRSELVADPGYLKSVLAHGISIASDIARDTLTEVRSAMGMSYLNP